MRSRVPSGETTGHAATVELDQVTKQYRRQIAVDHVSLHVDAGQFLTLLGPSGSGKSSILGLISGFITPNSGEVRLDGRDVTRLPPSERGIGVVFQDYALFPHMSVAGNVAYGLRRRRWPKRQIDDRVNEMLALVGLEDLGGRRPSQLSGGQQQRVALARALAFSPRLLLMDEPLAALDREVRTQMRSEIRRIHRELRPTVVYVTHDRDEAFALSDYVAIMRDGHIVGHGPPDEVYRRPRVEFVAKFFCGYHVVRVNSRGSAPHGRQRVRWAGCEAVLDLPPDCAGTDAMALPPSAIMWGGDDVEASVTDVVRMGPSTVVRCGIGDDGTVIAVELSGWHGHGVEPSIGDRVHLGVDLRRALLVEPDRRSAEDVDGSAIAPPVAARQDDVAPYAGSR